MSNSPEANAFYAFEALNQIEPNEIEPLPEHFEET